MKGWSQMNFGTEFFDAGLYRAQTRSIKWDEARSFTGSPDLLPMWVADMDFQCAPAIRGALLARAAHPAYGYTQVLPDDAGAAAAFMNRRHGMHVSAEEALLLPCVVAGMKIALRAVTNPGDGVIIMTPLYGPFAGSVQATGRTLVSCPLRPKEDGSYVMDMNAIEDALKKGAKALMLCNPHNPISRVWTRSELTELAELLGRYGAYLISDEIHSDFTYDQPFTSALELTCERVLIFCAPSKTFNVAGLQTAWCFCPDKAVRGAMSRDMNATGVTTGNLFGLDAARAAYTQCDDWLDGLIRYLSGSRRVLADALAGLIPEARLTPIEATYLAWIDMRGLCIPQDELIRRTWKEGVCFNDGRDFGAEGDGFLRLNFACPRADILEAVRRLARAAGKA